MDHKIRAMVRGAYDLQRLRIQFGGRVVANFKAKLGVVPSEKEDELDADAQRILKELRVAFDRITDGMTGVSARKGIAKRLKAEPADGLISDYTELCLVHEYLTLESNEKEQFKHLGHALSDVPVWTEFLEGVKGVGPAMAGVLVSEIDISKARYPSSLWKYAGLDVCHDGRGRSRKKEHLEQRAYVNKDGKDAVRVGITYNPFLKTKLMGVLASSFLRILDCPHRAIYDDYKHRLECHAVYGIEHDDDVGEDGKKLKVTSKLRRHNMAMRYMVKRFLVELHVAWRTIEGLPVSDEYSVAKLGRRHVG